MYCIVSGACSQVWMYATLLSEKQYKMKVLGNSGTLFFFFFPLLWELWMNNSLIIHWGRRGRKEKILYLFSNKYKVWKNKFAEQKQQLIFQRTHPSTAQQNCNKLLVDKETISHLMWKFHFHSVRNGLKKKSFKETHEMTERKMTRLTIQYSYSLKFLLRLCSKYS